MSCDEIEEVRATEGKDDDSSTKTSLHVTSKPPKASTTSLAKIPRFSLLYTRQGRISKCPSEQDGIFKVDVAHIVQHSLAHCLC